MAAFGQSAPPPSVFAKPLRITQILSCLEQTCGAPAFDITPENSLLDAYPFPKQFEQIWNRYEAKTVQNSEAYRAAARRLFAAKPALSFTPEEAAAIGFLHLQSMTAPIETFVMYDEESKKTRFDFNRAYGSAMSNLLSTTDSYAYTEYIRTRARSLIGLTKPVLENSLTTQLRMLYPNKSLHAALHAFSKTELAKLNNLNLKLAGFLQFARMPGYPALLQASRGQDLSRAESHDLQLMANEIDKWSVVITPPLRDTLSKLENPTNAYSDDFIKMVNDQLDIDIKTESDATLREQANALCRVKLSHVAQLTYSKQQLAQLQANIQNVRATAKILALRYVGASAASVIAAIDKLKFKLPDQGSKRLDALSQSENEQLDVLQADAIKSDKALVFALFKRFGTNAPPETTKTKLYKFCESIEDFPLSDYEMTALGYISVSWFTIAHPELGLGILAHEMGHAVAAAAREVVKQDPATGANFKESVSCVTSRNPYSFDGNNYWTEEDWADHFSSMVLHELKSTVPNMGCALVDNYRKSYAWYTNFPHPRGDDPHSSGLMRLLFIGLDRGTLSPVCSEMLEDIPAAGRRLECR